MTSLFGKLQVTASDFKIGIADALLVYAFMCYTEKTPSQLLEIRKNMLCTTCFFSEPRTSI